MTKQGSDRREGHSSLEDSRKASRSRIVLNRLIFRSMLFGASVMAIAISRVAPDKNAAWRFAKASARNLARACGVRVHIRGHERVGEGSYIFTPNHQSHFDIAALLGYLPGSNRFAAKKELFARPVLGSVLRGLGMISIDRGNPKAATDLMSRLEKDRFSTIIFPEGTRSRDGELLPFKKGAFVAAIELGLPVVPVVCKGTDVVMPKGGALAIVPGDVEIVVLEPVETADLSFADRDRLLETVRERMERELARPQSLPA